MNTIEFQEKLENLHFPEHWFDEGAVPLIK